MKIIQIMDNLITAGGVNSFVYDLCIALKEAGQDVTLIGIIGDQEEVKKQATAVRESGIPVHCLCMKSKKQALAIGIPKLRTIIREIAGDDRTICNLHLKLSVLMGGLATIGLKNVKCVETYHSQYSNYLVEYRIMSSRIKKYIACSPSAGKEMTARFHTPDNKLIIIPNGINILSLRDTIGLCDTHEELRILSVGRLTKQKNLQIAIDALNPLCNGKLLYQIVGEGEEYLTLVKSAGSNKSIQFLGTMERDAVIKLTKEADIIMMPSLWEGLSIYLMEAIALGKPLILSDIESFRDSLHEPGLSSGELYRRCSWGYLVSNSSSDGYRMAIQDFFNSNDEDKKEMSKSVFSLSERFNITETANKYLKVYNELAFIR